MQKQWPNSDDLWLRSSVIQKPLQTENATSIVPRRVDACHRNGEAAEADAWAETPRRQGGGADALVTNMFVVLCHGAKQ